MNKIKILYLIISLTILCGATFGCIKLYKKLIKNKEHKQLYKTEHPETKTILQDLSCAGILELKETYKIGSQVNGLVNDVLVKENETVKKGQLLATIDLVKGNNDIKIAKYALDKAQSELDYQEEYYKRQSQLYKSGQLSKNAFQRIEADYLKALADRNAAKITLEKAELEIQNTKIIAPADGIIINVGISKGMAVLNDFQNILFELAEDISVMKAVLDIDESEVGQVKLGQNAKIIINSYPDILIKNKISELSFIPKNGTPGNTQAFYKATVNMSNKNRTLRPGMRLNAQIRIAKAKDALCVNSMAFQIDSSILQKIADKVNFGFKSLDKKLKKEVKTKNADKITRFVWTEEDKTFVEKAIIVGITDEAYWQVLSGLEKNDKIVVDVQEPNAMEDLYSKWFQSAL
ncbi:MAG: Acr family acridine efflux pump AcrA [candidate division TM6 bacterium GW2011_GWF2_37_49]|nr:MAG: Acr family acridine efflux pump AcrA [candidate division TM6 bacterium GW2011_GWF2_37_49]